MFLMSKQTLNIPKDLCLQRFKKKKKKIGSVWNMHFIISLFDTSSVFTTLKGFGPDVVVLSVAMTILSI